jgi:hypothetical protein
MKVLKKSLAQTVQKVLADIYAQPDLRHDVFEYINPVVLKSYTHFCIPQAPGNPRNGLTSNSNAKVDTIEQHRQMENILAQELPNLIDIYTRLPIEYRNEKILSNGLTHRQTLIKSLQLLVTKLVAIENQIYEHEDKSMTVGHEVIREKYQNNDVGYFEPEHTTENSNSNSKNNNLPEFTNQFEWDGYKKDHPVKNREIDSSVELDSETCMNGEDIAHTIIVDKKSGEMKIRLKHPVRNFIAQKGKIAGNIMANLFFEGIWDHPVRFGVITLICALCSLGWHFIGFNNGLNNLEEEMVAPQTMAVTLNKNYSDNLHDVTLDAMQRYAKNHGMKTYTNRMPENDNREVAWFEKTVNKDTCMNVIDKFVSEGDSFFINNTQVSVDQKEFPIEERQALCNLDKNVISTGYFTTPEGQKAPATNADADNKAQDKNTNNNGDKNNGDKKSEDEKSDKKTTHTDSNNNADNTNNTKANNQRLAGKTLDNPDSEKKKEEYANRLWLSVQNHTIALGD